MKIFYLPRCEWKFILFLLFFIFSFLRNAINRWISIGSKDVAQPFLHIYLFTIADYLAIIPAIIIYIRSKRLNKEKVKINQKIELIYNDYAYEKSKNFIWYIFLVSFLEFSSHFSGLIYYIFYGRNERSISENNLSCLLIFNTIIIYLLSRWILKAYFYKHHYLSFIINIMCLLILLTIDIINIINSKDKDTSGWVIFYIIKKIISIILCSVEYVFSKKILMAEFINIYSLLFYRAFFGTIFLIFFSIPFIFIKVPDSTKTHGKSSIIFTRIENLFNALNVFKLIMFTITNLFYNIFIFSIIDKFSPSHYAISNILESFGTLIRLWIIEPETVDLPVLRMFIFFILIFGSIIHTELIVINYCDLQLNTKLFLEEKEKIDIQLIDNSRETKSGEIYLIEMKQYLEHGDDKDNIDNNTNSEKGDINKLI